jgi:hypothetical protein
MFEMGHDALNLALQDPVFGDDDWEFLAIGGRGRVTDMPLAGGRLLKAAPWLDYTDYAKLLRNSDILLSLMLSPHTSYPVLEMAACGGLVVTNAFETKTVEGLERISRNILASEATTEAIAANVVEAARRLRAGHNRAEPVNLPQSWECSLAEASALVIRHFNDLQSVEVAPAVVTSCTIDARRSP